MKKYFLALLLVLVPAVSFGQDYEPLLKEGKTWTYIHNKPFSEDYYYFTLVAKGDTTINDLTYKKIYDVSTDNYQYALREDGKQVFCVRPNRDMPELIYDFGKEAGEIVCERIDDNGISIAKFILRVVEVDAVKYGDRILRRMKVVEEYIENDQVLESLEGVWIEGLGSSCGLDCSVQEIGNNNTFISCQIGDDMLGENNLFFWAEGVPWEDYHTGIQVPTSLQDQTLPIYDLNGVRIAKPKKGVYIQNGKKVIVK